MPDDVLDDQQVEPQQQQGAADDQQQQQQGKPPETPEWQKAIADLATQVKTATAPKEQKQELTQEQKDELWAVYNPEKTKKDFMTKFFRLNPDASPEEVAEAKELFADMQKGLVRQSIVGARNIFQAELQKFREEIEPALKHFHTQAAEQTRSRFFKKYPVLEDTTFQPIVDLVAKQLEGREDISDEESFFQALADGAAKVIKPHRPDFDLGAKPATKQPAGTTPRLPRTSVGGTGGAGGGGTTVKKSKDDSEDIFS